VSHLLDVNVLLALLWPSHAHHSKVTAWSSGKTLTLCPISELGFIRISTVKTGQFNLSMADARKLLQDFISQQKPAFIPCDVRALDGNPAPGSGTTTDWYLANLADKHGLKLATFDAGLKHAAAELVA